MGILRADRVGGIGGANAFNGSVFFNGQPSSFLRTEVDSSDFVLGTSDFTIECWIYQDALDDSGLIHFGPGGYGYYNSIFHLASTNQVQLYLSSNGSSWDIASGTQIGTRTAKTWHHLALCRSGSSFYGFVDGTLGATITGQSGAIRQGASEVDQNQLCIGHRISTFNGYISNFRYIKGTALYTAAFTPPVGRLEKTSDTIILCCQSPGNVMQEATGKTLIVEEGGASSGVTASSGVGPPVASHFSPDIGEDNGTTFEDNTKFDTQSYLVPPGGTTAESNRGRAVFAGGYRAPDKDVNIISYVQIQSSGNTMDFGDLTQERASFSGSGNETRGWFASGYDYDSPNGNYDIIDYITIATTANALDFGNLVGAKRYVACLSNSTRGVSGGGYFPAYLDVIEYITIATTGNATDFGDITTATTDMAGLSSPTRGIFAGGASPSASLNTIEYITIATTGDATNFGDLTVARRASASANSSTRGVFAGGQDPSSRYNTIDYITIASAGNATDFGDLSATRAYMAKGQACSVTRGLLQGGQEPTVVNTIEYIDIATTGNATNFGDVSGAGCWEAAAACDSHGGLS